MAFVTDSIQDERPRDEGMPPARKASRIRSMREEGRIARANTESCIGWQDSIFFSVLIQVFARGSLFIVLI